MLNGGAESGGAEGWGGLEQMVVGEPGLRRGIGRSGEFAFCWRGQSSLIESDVITVDTGKVYELKGWFKIDGAPSGRVLYGLLPVHPESGRNLKGWNVFSLPGTQSELAEACVANDVVLKVKDASAWKEGPYAAAFGKGENEPNFDVTAAGIVEVKPVGDCWQVKLQKPCGFAFPSGTSIVENRTDAGHWIAVTSVDVLAGEWMEIRLKVKPKQWWAGVFNARAVIVPQRKETAWNLCADDLSMREAPE